MFRRLSTRISTLYTVLFLAVFAPAVLLVYLVILGEVKTTIRDELAANGGVFDRLLDARADQLKQSADVLSRDFGFREALATRDRATVESALMNLTGRIGGTRALVVGPDGDVIADASGVSDGGFPYPDILRDAEDTGATAEVAVLDGVPQLIVASPVFAPTLQGWTVFAEPLADGAARELAGLAPIALRAQFQADGMAGVMHGIPNSRALRLLNDRTALAEFVGERGGELVLIKSLDVSDSSPPVTLSLNYPIAASLARYRHLAAAVIGFALAGMGALMTGSWLLSAGVTRPIRALADAVARIQAGDYVQVEAKGGGEEVRGLADGFNAMVEGINSRERRITHLALHDPDTGLANRAALQRHLTDMIEGAAPGPGERIYLAAAGVDRFATIRAAIGHGQAGVLMREVARKLEGLRPGDFVARLSSSALGVAFRAPDAAAAAAIVAQARTAFERDPIAIGSNAVDIHLTVGLAGCPEHAENALQLVERAQIALDQARAATAGAASFDPESERATAGNLALLSELRRGLELGEVALAHQPKLDLRKGEVTGVECLLRWIHPVRGPVAPDAFIPLAEETGLIGALTEWVLARALDDQRRYAKAGHDLRIAVNISARSLANPGFADLVASLLRSRNVEPERLTLEITETAAMERPDVAFATLEKLQRLGVILSIDDYGTGLSSLAYLKRLPVHELKIDKSFVLNLSKDKNDAVLVRSTIDLGHNLGLKVVAEGVEDQASLELLALFGCDYAQGFHIGRPTTQDAVIKSLASPEPMRLRPRRAAS
jgi:diguanylate cyclase (GGDEF)-like protein